MPVGDNWSFLNDTFHLSSTKQAFDVRSTITYLLPAFLSYIAFAILAIRPGTRTLRIALWPLVALLAFRAATCVDLSNGNPKNAWFNVDFAVSLVIVHTGKGTAF